MKKGYLLGLFIGLFLLMLGGSANALSIKIGDDYIDVGNLDVLLEATELKNAGDPAVTEWINSALDAQGFGTGYVLDYKNDGPFSFFDVYENETIVNKTYAYDLYLDAQFFLLKIGTGGTSVTADHFLFENINSLNYAVFSLEQLFGADYTNNNIDFGRISHVTEIGGAPVPEPTTLLLFGTGLLGLAGLARRKRN